MTRFPNWTMKDVEKANSRISGIKPTSQTRNIVKTVAKITNKIKVDHVAKISAALEILGVEHKTEYKFLHDRRFRFDIAIPNKMIAIEFEGGIYSGGRHTRGKGYSNDAKKYNLATRHGWKLLRYTTDDTNELNYEFRIADEIKQMVGSK